MARIITSTPPEVKKMGATQMISTRGVVSDAVQARAYELNNNIPAEATVRREPYSDTRVTYYWTWYEVIL